eukprot:Sspe_Gene.9890::Locus_3325_Transcript_3_3_Confidence_0.600_Length_3071::g.9890::m.9890/K13523/AGPAT3_4; lysophosphatidic acid acyltransferase / lysophosphatidylinositol acyltransferase
MLTSLKRSGVFIPFLATTFLISGLLTNVAQLLTLLVVYPFSVPLYRKLNALLAWWWWCIPVWLVDWWSGTRVRFFAPRPEDLDHYGKENVIILCNHCGDIDWLIGWVTAERHGVLGHTKSYMKSFSKFLPILGWSWWFVEYIFLVRDWSEDKAVLQRTFKSLNGFPSDLPFWVALFAEGTRQTPQKLKESQDFCRAKGLPVLQHVMWPRTKGFVSSVQEMREKLDAIYCFTIAFPDKDKQASFPGLLQGDHNEIQMCLRRFPLSDLPKDDEGLKQFCCKVYQEKDDFLQNVVDRGTFPGKEMTLKPRLTTRAAMWFWTAVVQGGIWYTALRSVVRGEYATLLFIVATFAVTGVLLMYMIRYSEAKRSSDLNALKKKKQ